MTNDRKRRVPKKSLKYGSYELTIFKDKLDKIKSTHCCDVTGSRSRKPGLQSPCWAWPQVEWPLTKLPTGVPMRAGLRCLSQPGWPFALKALSTGRCALGLSSNSLLKTNSKCFWFLDGGTDFPPPSLIKNQPETRTGKRSKLHLRDIWNPTQHTNRKMGEEESEVAGKALLPPRPFNLTPGHQLTRPGKTLRDPRPRKPNQRTVG